MTFPGHGSPGRLPPRGTLGNRQKGAIERPGPPIVSRPTGMRARRSAACAGGASATSLRPRRYRISHRPQSSPGGRSPPPHSRHCDRSRASKRAGREPSATSASIGAVGSIRSSRRKADRSSWVTIGARASIVASRAAARPTPALASRATSAAASPPICRATARARSPAMSPTATRAAAQAAAPADLHAVSRAATRPAARGAGRGADRADDRGPIRARLPACEVEFIERHLQRGDIEDRRQLRQPSRLLGQTGDAEPAWRVRADQPVHRHP